MARAATSSGLGPTDHGAGLWRRLDPRTRILAAVAAAIVIVSLQTVTALVAALGLAVMTAVVAALPPWPTARRLLAMDGFIVALLVLLPFTTPGTPIATIGPFTATLEGLDLAISIALKANAVILLLLALVGTLGPVRLGQALGRLAVPARLVHLLLFTVRYIDVLRAEAARLRNAMRARAFRPATDRHTLKTMGYLVGMLVIRAAERAERVLKAMKCRGFDGRLPLFAPMRFGPEDAVAAIAATLVFAALLFWDLSLAALA